MADVSQTQVEEVLKTYIDPYLETDLVSAKAIKDIKIDGSKVSVDVVLGYPADGFKAELSSKLKEKVEALSGVSEASFNISHKHKNGFFSSQPKSMKTRNAKSSAASEKYPATANTGNAMPSAA